MRLRITASNIILALISVSFTLVLCEAAFRTLLFSDLPFAQRFKVPGLYADPMSDDDYWKLEYLFDTKFPPPARPHPVLGWVGDFSRDTYEHNEIQFVGGKRPVLFYGDSFAGCVARPCFQEILNAASDFSQQHYFLNYGVGGYGVDQIYLLLKNSIPLYKNPIVVVSIMTEDLDRSLQSVRVGQKPYFEVIGDQLVLRGTPINPVPAAYFVEHPSEIKSYLYSFLMHSDFLPWRWRQALNGEEELRRKKTVINRHIILSMVKELRERNLEFMFVIFHPKEHPPFDNWRDKLLRDVLATNHVPFVAARDLVKRNAIRTHRAVDEYYIPGDSHPNAYQNDLIATAIKEFVVDGTLNERITSNIIAEIDH